MTNSYFNPKDTLYTITTKYPETVALFISIGFANMEDQGLRESFGKSISLEMALKLKNISLEGFSERLIEKIKEQELLNTNTKPTTEGIHIAGVLPCPVKFPLLEAFENFVAENPLPFELTHELKAASMGVDWLKELLQQGEEEKLPDVFISAGFDLFFDTKLFGGYKTKNVFEDLTDLQAYNKDFNNANIQLKDPKAQYAMLGVVPTVFLVNTDVLEGREIPKTWDDLLSPAFEKSVSLPIADLDLFNALLLHLYKEYGEEGLRKLGRSLKVSMHPSQMVKSHNQKQEKPAVTIMPYFFTNMVKENTPMKAIWPEDGAIISPIFMLSKKAKKDKLKPLVDFFSSVQVGEILAHNGRFPSIHPQVDNRVPQQNTYKWIGWDFIENNDIGELLRKCEAIFHQAAKGE